MKYILMMVVDERSWENLTPDQMQPMIDEMERFNDAVRGAGAWVSGEGLDFSRSAKTVRVSDGRRSVEDGPAMDSKEQVGGFWIIEAESMDAAVDWARKVPMTNGSVEVRSLVPEDVGQGQ
jgi:hypothetical protein